MNTFKTNDTYYPLAVDINGTVKNLNTGNIRAFYKGNHGYPIVSSRSLGTLLVHRMVAEIWIPNPSNLPCVNHKDFDKTNNSVLNLEWVTSSQNSIHAASAGRMSHDNRLTGEDSNLHLYTDDTVHSICLDLSYGLRNVDVDKKYGVHKGYCKELKMGLLRKDITCQYDLVKTNNKSVSVETVEWICGLILEGFTNKQIVDLSTNMKVTSNLIKNIKRKTSYKSISDNYF